MKILNFSRFMKLNESKSVAKSIGSAKLENGKTINFYRSETVDSKTKKAVISASFDIDKKDMTTFYPNGKCKNGLCNKDDATILKALGVETTLEFNNAVKVIKDYFQKNELKVSIKKINV
jgi:hypothetical protein